MKKEELEEKEANKEDNGTQENDTDTSQETKANGESESQEGGDEEMSETDRLKEEVAQAKDKYIRLYSEFENFRRRTSKEKLDLINTANEKLLVDLLPVIDDFERAEKSMEEETEVEVMKEGFQLISNKLLKLLAQKGLKAMESKGTTFDSDIQEAITQIPAPEEELKGKVVDVIEKGYFLNDKVIRFAKVVIGN